MKKRLIIIIIIVVVAVLALAGGAYWLGTRSSKNQNTNAAANTNFHAANINAEAPPVTYEPYSGNLSGFTFDTVKEWTSVAPSEVQKSVTAEQLNGYSIVYYSTNPQVVVLSVSEKEVSQQETLGKIVEDDLAASQKISPALVTVDKRVTDTDARLEATLTNGQSDYTIYSRYLLVNSTTSGTEWALLEVSVPTSRVSQYMSVVERLLGSLKLDEAATNNNNLPE